MKIFYKICYRTSFQKGGDINGFFSMVAVTSDWAALVWATIIGQAIAVLSRLKANTEQLQKQGETFVHAMERLED